MRKTILRLFHFVRDLESRLQEAGSSRLEMQGQLRRAEAELDRLREERDAALSAERKAYQMLVNFQYQSRYGYAPFPDAPMLPERLEPNASGPLPEPTGLADEIYSEAVREARAEFDALLAA